MATQALFPGVLFGWALFLAPLVNTSAAEIRVIRESPDAAVATIRVHTKERSPDRVPKAITGKFAEHLGANIYNGMDAQILRNPTFAEYPFWNGQMTPDGVTKFQVDEERIKEELRRQAIRFGWPESELPGLVVARVDALACFWGRVGSREQVKVSPDTGPHGGRAQRIEVTAAGQGIMQWSWLPLHRQRRYEFEIMARSPEIPSLTVSLWSASTNQPVALALVSGMTRDWQKLRGSFIVPVDLPNETAYKVAITANAPGQFVLRHALLRPADHVLGADPDIVRFLQESRLSLLRWPGGNFVSTHHWEDGVGPIEQRPTKPNFAWGAVEPNTFGTDEFVAFCRVVGCEPMICINAGSGTPEEAARWIQYCNGPATSPLGRLRAANGHPEPFQIRLWEVGNELWGSWQMDWTTPNGYVDRYEQFAKTMRASDPSITLYACGAPAMSGKKWNDALIAGVGSSLPGITDHPLIGGNVPASTEPIDVYRDFMAVPEVLQEKWASLRGDMIRGGIKTPHLAVTELQLFAHLSNRQESNAPVRLTYRTMPSQGSITEAIYDILIYHAALRLAPFVDMITHSAVVNHGGGLRKERERVWANPCHYAQAAFAEFADAQPVRLEIETALENAPMVLPDLKQATNQVRFGAIDAFAAVAPDRSLLISLVHRGTSHPIRVNLVLDAFPAGATGELLTLTATTPWADNTLERPDLIKPIASVVSLHNGTAAVELAPYTVARLRVPTPSP